MLISVVSHLSRSLYPKGWCRYDVHENFPIFKTPHALVDLPPKSFHPFDLGRPISNDPTSPNNNQSVKRKHNPRMAIICYQIIPSVGFRFQYQLVNLIWLSFDFFSFS